VRTGEVLQEVATVPPAGRLLHLSPHIVLELVNNIYIEVLKLQLLLLPRLLNAYMLVNKGTYLIYALREGNNIFNPSPASLVVRIKDSGIVYYTLLSAPYKSQVLPLYLA
jgi:hypothetical protein